MMIDRAEVLKGLLLGVKAPQMSCTGIDGETHELYDIKSPYTIVYFIIRIVLYVKRRKEY